MKFAAAGGGCNVKLVYSCEDVPSVRPLWDVIREVERAE
jgi:hypothetical protein